MIVFPAIDLKDRKCVRLFKGDMNEATVFNENPVEQAQQFVNAGFEWLHIVDLNGAFEGKPMHSDIVQSIVQETSIRIQLGGGIRTLETIEHWLELGINRIILGTAALRDPELVRTACKQFPNQIVVGIDARGGKVAVDGWAKTSEVTTLDLATQFQEAGVAAIIYTDIERDGALTGPDIEGVKKLAQSTSIPIIASGGVSNIDDIKAVKSIEELGVEGVICGRALYEKQVTPEEIFAI